MHTSVGLYRMDDKSEMCVETLKKAHFQFGAKTGISATVQIN